MTDLEAKEYIAGLSPEALVMIIAGCAARLGWQLAIEEGQENLRGLTIGTQEYINAYFKEDK